MFTHKAILTPTRLFTKCIRRVDTCYFCVIMTVLTDQFDNEVQSKIMEEPMVAIHIKLPLSMKEKLHRQAKQEGRTLSNYVRYLLQNSSTFESPFTEEPPISPLFPCPRCGNEMSYYKNVEKTHWGVCLDCNTRFTVGNGIFSSWKNEDEKIWAENEKHLAQFEFCE